MAESLDLLSAGLDVTEPVAGADLLAPVKRPSAIAEGFRGATAGAKASLAGFGALAASSIGADTVKQAALQTAAEQTAIAEEHARRVEDVDSAGGAWEHYKYLLGSAVPTLALMLAGGLAGRGLGAVLSRGAPVATRAAAMRAGALGGAVAADVPLEAGEIYTSALAEGTMNPELRAAAGGALAASLDFIPLLAAERYLRAAGRGGFGAAVKGAVKGAPVGAALEGGQEAAQAVIERGFAGKSLTDGEALSDYLNSFLGGAAPGVLFGGATGALRSRAPVQEPGPASLPTPADKPLPEILGDSALNAQASDIGLLGSFADAQGGAVPQPLSTTGPQLPATEAPSRFNRAQALVAEDADLTDRAILADQRDQAQARLAEIGTLMESASRRDKAILQREAETLAASLPALDTQIGVLDTQIGNRARMAVQPEVPAAAERTGTAEGVVLGEQTVPDTTEAERAIAETKRALGLLVSSREAQLAPLQSVGTSPQVQTVTHTPRSTERQPDQKTLTGAMIEAGRRVAAQDLPGIVKTRAEGVLKKPTPAEDKARERAMRDAVDSVITEAAALPSVEAAQAHVQAEMHKAVKGRVDAKTAGELADRVSRGLAQAPRYYSKGAVTVRKNRKPVAQRQEAMKQRQLSAFEASGGEASRRGEPRNPPPGSKEIQEVWLRGWDKTGLAAPGGGVTYDQSSTIAVRGPAVYDIFTGDDGTLLEGGFTSQAEAERFVEAEVGAENVLIRRREHGEVFGPDDVGVEHPYVIQKSVAATDAAQDVYDEVMERQGQDAIKRFQFLYGEHGETFDIFAATAEAPNAGYYQAMQEMKDVIGFAFNANNLPSVADHEAFHALEQRKLDARERAILSRALKPGQTLFDKVVETARRYDREQQTNITDEILSIPAEARAYAFQFWRQGELQVEGAVQTIFAKIKEFIQRVGNMLRGQGFQSVEDIWRAIDKGALAARARREGGTIRRNAERDPADPRFAPDFESFRSLMTLKYGSKMLIQMDEHVNGAVEFEFKMHDPNAERRGTGNKAMQDFTDFADLNQRGLFIFAESQDKEKFPQAKLEAWYGRHGFVPVQSPRTDGTYMYREPRRMTDGIYRAQAGSPTSVAAISGDEGGDLDFTRFSKAGPERWYYSALTRAVEQSSTKSASPEGWGNVLRGLKGVKPDEIKWSGLEEWLALQSGRVTQEQVVSYLRENGVRVEEVTLGAEKNLSVAEAAVLLMNGGQIHAVPRDNPDATARATLDDNRTILPYIISHPESVFLREGSETDAHRRVIGTKFSAYQLPGGSNYRELLLTLPEVETGRLRTLRDELERIVALPAELRTFQGQDRTVAYDQRMEEFQRLGGKPTRRAAGFRSSHFDQPNILAHVRFNERTDAEGKRVLFIEELQSDWAQKGKKEGFKKEASPAEITAAWQKADAAIAKLQAAERAYFQSAESQRAEGPLWEALLSAKAERNAAQMDYDHIRGGGTVPQAPFVGKTDAWVALALKRMIRYASEHGFDKIAWTTGEQQVSRYAQALQKQVDRIEWEKTKDGVHLVGYKGGRRGSVDGVPQAVRQAAFRALNRNDNLGFDTQGEALAAIRENYTDWTTRWSVTAENDYNAISRYIDAWIHKDVSGTKVVDTRYAETELSDAIGKAMADRITQDPAQSGVLEGEQITVSDTGMAAFYDRIVPNVANEVLRKLGGGKVGEVNVITRPADVRESPNITDAQWAVMVRNRDVITTAETAKQQGFTLTPQMRQAVMAGGLPLFSKAAVDPALPRPIWLEKSGRDLDRLFADGQVPREQKLRGAATMLDEANLPDTTFQQMLGYSKAEMGTVKEFWHKHFASGNYLSRFSQGYKNVQQALSTFTQRKSQLFAHAMNVQLSDWVNANDTDIQATSDAIFKATVGSMQKGSPEYVTLYGGLTPKQQEMFRQVFGDKDKPGVIADMLQKEFEADSRDMKAELPPAEFAEWAANRRTRVQKLIQDSYVPERRYGDYTVKIYHPGADGKNAVLFYEQYESRGEAALAASRYQALLKEKGVESLQVEFGTRHQNDRDTGLSLRQFFSAASRHGIPLTAAERQKIARALVSADSARMNRIMQRKNIPGHSQDGLRVLSEFALTMASKIAHSEFTDAIEAALTGREVDTQVVAGKPVIKVAQDKTLWQADGPHSGFYRNLADRLADFVLSPPQEGKWAQQLKAAGTLYFLGGNLSFGLVNLTSLPMNTVPWLSAHAPYTQAFATVMSLFGTVAKHQQVLRDVSRLANRDNKIEGIEDDLRSALVQAAEDGTTLDTEIHHLMGLTKGQQFTNSRKVQKAMDAWMLPFRMSEQLNRITTFSAAYRIGRDVKKLTGRELYKFAQDAVASTQGRYDEANRPGFGQSPLWSTLFMFKSFPIFMIEMILTLHKQSPAAAVKMLLGLTMAAGVTGLPFAEDLMDIVDVISQRLFGSSFNTKRAMRNVVKDASEAMVGADLSNLVLNGAVNDWLGVNLSTRVGLGNLIPGTRLGAADNDYKRTLEEVLGPAGGMLTAVASGLDHVTKLEFIDALKAGAPVAGRNAIKGAQQLASGEAVDTQGRKLLDVNGWEAFWQTLGFSSSGLNKLYQLDRLDKQAEAYYTQVKEDFAKDLVRAVREGDSAAAQATMEAVQAWNEAHPELPISFAAPLMRRRIMEAGLPLNERTLRNLPRQLRGTSTAIEGMQ